MEFSQALRAMMERSGCTARELAQRCGMSPSTVSRYLAGTRTPDAQTFPTEQVAQALCDLARERCVEVPTDVVREALAATLRGKAPEGAGKKLSTLLETFGVTKTRLADALGYSPSYVSRLCSEERTPANYEMFAQAAGVFFAEWACAADAQGALASLCGCDTGDPESLAREVALWLCEGEARADHLGLEPFLRKLDAFDLEKYLAAMKCAPAADVPTCAETASDGAAAPYRMYTSVEGFCQAELDFLACAAAELAGSSVTLFSDMPMQDKMQACPDFPARWVAALAQVVRSGHTIDNIHNVGRSLPEMMLGLEAWLPLYMTGMVRPYYLPMQVTGPFGHLMRSCETAALEGQAIVGAYEHVGCELFCDEAAVAHFRRRASDLLACAKPLANIYTAQHAHELAAFLGHEAAQGGDRRAILAAPPLFTMDEELLEEVLGASGLSAEEAQHVRMARAAQLSRVKAELAGGEMCVSIARVTPENFAAAIPCLALGEAFCTHSVAYTREAYARHLELTEKFAAEHGAWQLTWSPDLGFRNIQITVRPGAWALVSKNTSLAIHFVLHHKKMVEAFERFEMPVVE